MVDVREWVTPNEPEINRLAAELGSPAAIYDYMQQVTYIPGYYLQKPLQVLHAESGDCDEQAVLLCSLLRAIGEEAFVRIAAVPGALLLHAWVVWRDPATGLWVNLDPSGTVEFEDLGYGETVKIEMLVDFNEQEVFDYGGLWRVIHVFKA